jgi:hypothetical protein
LDLNTNWWVYAELDQLAGTMALNDPEYEKYLPKAYHYWFDHFVDKEFGEVWNAVDGKTNAPIRNLPKQWAWKNAYHSFEHALVGYITAQELHNMPVSLYYSFPDEALPPAVQPYYFTGDIQKVDTQDEHGQRVEKVSFVNVRYESTETAPSNHHYLRHPQQDTDNKTPPSTPRATSSPSESNPQSAPNPSSSARGPAYPSANHGLTWPKAK